MSDTFETTLADAESKLKSIAGYDGDDEDLVDADLGDAVANGIDELRDDEDRDGIVGDLQDVVRAIDEAEDVLESIDFSELPDAVDREQLLEAIELGNVPDALRDSEDEEVVKLRRVIGAIRMRELLSDVDVSKLWSSKRNAEDAVDDLTDDEEDEGVIGKAATAIADDDDQSDDDELIETDVDDVVEMGAREARQDFELGDGDLSEYEAIIQQQAIEGVDAFRDALLKAHGEFEKVVEFNRERTRNIDRRSNSRNPTAVSTIVTDRADLTSTPNYSTIPRRVRHSNAPSRKHIYGKRFEQERKRRGYDDE